jgi:hypothetical protein
MNSVDFTDASTKYRLGRAEAVANALAGNIMPLSFRVLSFVRGV